MSLAPPPEISPHLPLHHHDVVAQGVEIRDLAELEFGRGLARVVGDDHVRELDAQPWTRMRVSSGTHFSLSSREVEYTTAPPYPSHASFVPR